MTATVDADTPENDPFRFGAIARVVPTTDAQREVLAAAALGDLANCAYNEAVSIRLTGAIDPDVVERALAQLAARHDALRATFTPQLDALCVRDEVAMTMARDDLTALAPAARERAVEAARRAVVATPLPLFEGPLFRARWLQLGDDCAELLLVGHHAVCDGWSYHVLLRELEQLCGPSGGAALAAAPSFADFAAACAAGTARDHGAHWLRKFASTPPPLELPLDRPRGPRRGFQAQRVARRLAAGLPLVELAGQLRVSPVTIVIAGVAALLHRLTGVDDLVLGMPVARQAIEDRGGLVGHCVQLLPVRLAVDASTRFDELVAAARREVLDATEHYDFTFGSLVQALRRSGDAGRVPLVPVLVNIDQAATTLRLGAAHGVVTTVPRIAESFEVFLNVQPEAGGMVLEATFQSELFDAASVTVWLEALEQLLLAAAAAPQAPVGALSLVAAQSTEHGVVGPVVPLAFTHWLEAFDAIVRRCGRAVAVRDERGEITYEDLQQRIDGIAAALVGRGVGPGDVVGLCVGRSREMIAGMAAVHACGAAHLPLDPGFPLARLQQLVDDSGATLVVVDAEGAALGLPGPCLALHDLPADGGGAGAAPPAVARRGEDLAYLIYTSGSTGVPKGVEVTHRSLANLLAGVAATPGFSSADTLLAVTTMSFDISLLELLLPLTVGGCVAVASRHDAEDPQKLVELLRRHRATAMQATPATWRMLVDYGWSGAGELVAFCGGERLPPELARSLLPRVKALWNLYGPTETTVWSTLAQVVDAASAARIGLPIQNTSVFVLDAQGGMAPRGVPGELCIGGEGVAVGYRARPQLTAERFVVHPLLGRLYRTGDRGRVCADGTLECLGRIDHQVKVRGFRIELGEVEAALRSCPGVVDAVVAVQGDEAAAARLVGFVVTASGATPDGWREHVRRTLPAYMVPHQLAPLAALPRLPNGKLDRRGLPVVAAATPDSADFVAPATPEERLVAAEMAAVLGLPRLGATDDFFACGGHSLLAAQLVVRLNRATAGALSMRAVFEAPTPRALAARLSAATAAGAARVTRRPIRDVARATLVQERMWHLEQLTTQSSSYNLPSAHRLRGPLDEDAFARALQEIVRRQSALRTTFERHDGAVWQIVHDRLRLAWPPLEDLSDLPEPERERRLAARLDELAGTRFDLRRLPLFRVQLFRLSRQEHVFFFMPHHTIWDGWSFDLLYEEMDAIYGAFSSGKPSPLPELAVEFGDVAFWQQERAASPDARGRVEQVRKRLADFGSVAPLPVDHRRSLGMSGRGACEWLNLGADRTRAMHDFARERGVTLFATALAVYAALLHEHSAQDRLLLATPVRGRDTAEQEPVMGCSNTLVPVPIDVGAAATFDDLVRQVRDAVVGGLATADVTLEQIAGAGARNGSVLYQALFSFQDVRGRRRRWGGLEHEMIPLFQRGATEDLGLWFVEGEQGLGGMLTYNAEAFEHTTVLRLRDRFGELVTMLLGEPQAPLARQLEKATVVAPSDAIVPPTSPSRAGGQGAQNPRNDFELVLVRIWQEILGVEEIGVHDDFFALGGNSLSAIRCVERFEAATGVTIELGEVFRSPTAAQLAASLVSRAARSGAMLIPLQERGHEPPLFCLLGIQIYRHLALGLGEHQPVFGVYVPDEQAMLGGLPGERTAAVSIEHLADAYVRVIRSNRPEGPYRIAGLSFGGVVALEVARRLVALGAEVDRVLLIDSILPTSYRRRWWRLPARSWLLQLATGWRQLVATMRPGAASNRDEDAGQAPGGAFRGVRTAMLREIRQWMAAFVPPPCSVLLLRARDNSWGRGLHPLPDYGWGVLLGSALQVATIPGDHVGMLLTPQGEALAGPVRMFLEGTPLPES